MSRVLLVVGTFLIVLAVFYPAQLASRSERKVLWACLILGSIALCMVVVDSWVIDFI